MSDRMTSARMRNGKMGGGYAMYGRVSRNKMIAEYRAFAKHELAKWQIIANAKDEDIIVETYVGVFAMNNISEVAK